MVQHVQTYRYGEPLAREILHIGVARHLPRGVAKKDYRSEGYFDLWLPVLAPEPALIKDFRGEKINYASFGRKYRAFIDKAEPRGVIQLLAYLSHLRPIALGCFCEKADHCHRSLLAQRVCAAASKVDRTLLKPLKNPDSPTSYASSPCMLNEVWEELTGEE